MKKKMTAVILALTLCLALSVTAFAAADTPSLDLSREGSVTVTLYSDENEAAVTDGTLTLYEVASLYLDNGNRAYEKTEDFAAFEGTLDVDDAALCDALAAYVAENSLTGISARPDAEGVVSFNGLELGLYLVVQTTQSEGYLAIDPFLVTVPMAGESEWIYDVDASPKTEIEPIPEEPENPDNPDNPENPDNPDNPDNPENPENPNDSDSSDESDGSDEQNQSVIPGNSGGGSSSSSSSGSATLPQTGQLNWPIPFLAVGGMVLVVLGCVLMRRKRTDAA